MVPGVILAGGDSVRMGTPKALLQDTGGRTFVSRIARSMSEAGVNDLVVVTGRHHEAIAESLRDERLPCALRLVQNVDPSRGQLSSLWVGMDAVCRADTAGLAVTLVDVPLVAVATIRSVLDAWSRTGAPIVRPVMDGRGGHPVIFDRALFAELRQAPLASGARAVVSAHYDEMVNVPVTDRGCLVDVDTPQDYELLLRRGASRRARVTRAARGETGSDT